MLGAMDADQNLTSLGRVLLQLPVDAPIGKLCLYGSFFRCLDSALTLAAVLTNRDPFMAPLAAKQEAERIKDSWSPRSFRSDPLAIVAAYNAWKQIDDQGNYSRSTAFCQENFLSKQTLLQIKQVKQSLVQSLEQAGVIAVSSGGNFRQSRFRREVPEELNVNGNSLPLLAALISMASAPNFAIRTSEKLCRTAQDKVSRARAEIQGGQQLTLGCRDPPEFCQLASTRTRRPGSPLVELQHGREAIIRFQREIPFRPARCEPFVWPDIFAKRDASGSNDVHALRGLSARGHSTRAGMRRLAARRWQHRGVGRYSTLEDVARSVHVACVRGGREESCQEQR